MNSISLLPRDKRKAVLGAYAAMGRNNAYLIVKDIMDQLGISQPDMDGVDLEAHISQMALFSNSLLPETELRAQNLLFKHFPFLKVAMDCRKNGPATFEDIKRCLRNALDVLGNIRDHNVHFKLFEETNTPRYFYLRRSEMFWGRTLRDILSVAPRSLKEKYIGTGLLTEDAFTFYKSGQYLPDRKDRRKFVFNQRWIFNPQRAPVGDERQVYDLDRDGHPMQMDRISEIGEILTVALFIERGYTHFFLKDVGLLDNFKENGDAGRMSEQRIIRELFSFYALRLPERRIDIALDSTQVSLDMFNELRRCPSELYDVLPEEARRPFHITGSDGTPMIMKRYSDRYVPMILRYLDTSESLSRIRFQVNIGKVRYQLHGEVPYMDGEARERIIQTDINAFARIQDVEQKKMEDNGWFGLPLLREDEDGRFPDLPAVLDSRSKYVLNNNLIGISIHGDQMPRMQNDVDANKIRVSCPEPDCWLSRYDLPGFVFYHYLGRKFKSAKTAEDVIIEKTEAYRDFFRGVADGSICNMDNVSIPRKDIPEKLLTYLSGGRDGADFPKYKASQIAFLENESKERLQRLREDLKAIESKDNKPGKKSFVRIQPGKLAAFLTQDIVRFQSCPEGHPEKRLTGQQYSILQGMIATFSKNLESSCSAAGLLSGETSHPFLAYVFNRHKEELTNTVQFYRAYLEERLSYLKGVVPDSAPFLHADKAKWAKDRDSHYYQALAHRYIADEKTGRSVGIFLPGGLFEEPIRELLREHCPGAWKEISRKERSNTAFMILTYLEEELADGYQDFYYDEDRLDEYGFARLIRKEIEANGYSRIEAIGKKESGRVYKEAILYQLSRFRAKGVRKIDINKRMIKPSRPELPLPVRLKAAFNRMTVNEKAIRRFAIQDVTMFLLARQEMDQTEKLKLCRVSPEGKGILDQKVDVRTQLHLDGRSYLIEQKQVSIKDQGEINKVLRDKRIDSLLKNAGSASGGLLDLNDIKEELAGYNRQRVPVISTIHGYEERVYEANSREFESSRERFDFKDIQNADTTTPAIEKEALRRIRNAFCHNEYPNQVVYKDGLRAELYSKEMPEIAEEIAGNAELLVEGTK